MSTGVAAIIEATVDLIVPRRGRGWIAHHPANQWLLDVKRQRLRDSIDRAWDAHCRAECRRIARVIRADLMIPPRGPDVTRRRWARQGGGGSRDQRSLWPLGQPSDDVRQGG